MLFDFFNLPQVTVSVAKNVYVYLMNASVGIKKYSQIIFSGFNVID